VKEALRPEKGVIVEMGSYERALLWKFEAPGAVQYGVRRLPNGNTPISEDVSGRNFEVTPTGEIVWEVRNPHWTCRPHRYSYVYCPKIATALR
jgi:hypothetical protein